MTDGVMRIHRDKISENRRSLRSFTVIEMTLVISILAMIGLAVNRSVVNSLKLWELSRHFTLEEDAIVFLDKIGVDLRNAFAFSQFNFEGEETRLSIPTLVRVPQDKKISEHSVRYVDQIGKVEYLYDKASHAVIRKQANYSQALKSEFGTQRVVVSPVQALKLSYLVPDGQDYIWKKELDHVLPVAVLVEIQVRERNGDTRTLTRLLDLPIAG